MNKIFTLSLMGLMALSAQAQNVAEFDYGYATPDAETSAFGVGRLVKYDVAILINNPSLKGYEVVGVTAEISNREECACAPEASGWLASELLQDKNYNVMTDLALKNGLIENVGSEDAPKYILNVDFDEPYTITDEPFYAGYTVSVTALKSWTQGYPVVTTPSANPQGGLYVHCDKGPSGTGYKYLEWTDLAESRAAVSTMTVRLRGPRGEESVKVTANSKIYPITGEEYSLPVTLTNFGFTEVDNIAYSVSCDDVKIYEGKLEFNDKISNRFGEQRDAELKFTVPSLAGDYAMTLTVDEVNGKPNLDSGKEISFEAIVRDYFPNHIPLVEEYTGLWCGQCPEAYVLLCETREKHPELLYLAFHENDALMTISPGFLPAVGGAPRLTIDRSSAGSYNEFEGNWLARRAEPAPADIDLYLSWTDDTKSQLRVDADVRFTESYDASNYALTYCLVADKMSDPDYKQRNFFYDDKSRTGKYWDLFVGKGMEVSGLEFNEVVLAFPDCKGIEDSLPETIVAGEKYSHHTTFNLADVKNVYLASALYGQNILKESDKENLRVVGVITDLTTGKSYNCNTTGYSGDASVYNPDSSGIDEISSEISTAQLISREYFTIEGLPLAQAPEKGMFIVVERYDDGRLVTAKKLQ